MEALTSAMEAVNSVESLDVASFLSAIHDIGAARDAVEVLLNAYNEHSGTSRETLQKQCVMRCLAELLEYANARHTRAANKSSSNDGTSGVRSVFWRAHANLPSTTHTDWVFSAEDYLLLSMFLNETATTSNGTVFAHWSRATVVVFPHATALAFPSSSSDNSTTDPSADEEAETTRASLESELHSLRDIVGRRLTTTVDSLRRLTSYECARRSLQSGVWALLGALAACATAAVGERVVADLEAAVDGLLHPLQVALQEQLSSSSSSGRSGKKLSPLLLTALLQDVEDVLWVVPHIAVSDRSARSWMEPLCARAAAFVVDALLKFAQQYITLRQQRQMESMDEDGGAAGGGAGGGGQADGRASARAAKKDVFRVYHVQRSVQRVLSVALRLRHVVPTTAGATPGSKTAEVSLVGDAAFGGLQAAVSAFGGAVFVADPVSLSLGIDEPEDESQEEEDDAAVGTATSITAWQVTDADDAGGRLRDCRRVLVPPHHLTAGGSGTGGDGGDYDLFHDDDGALLGRREPYLKSSLGPVTASALVDMVMLTVSRMDFLTEDAIQELHRRGLEQMQLAAAYAAQREEVEKLRQMERQGVEAIAAGKLIEHVKDSAALHTRGMQILRKVSARARLERAAFTSVLGSYQHVRGEAEARVRLTQALISRCLVQLPLSLADSAMDELFLHLRRELTRAQTQKEAGAAAGGAGSSGSAVSTATGVAVLFEASSYYQLTLQVLFMYFATQAPMHERSATWNNALMLGGAGAGTGEEDGTGLGDDGGAEWMQSEAGFSIEVDSPIAFLYDDDVHRASQDVGQKRTREDGEGAGGEEEGAARAGGGGGGGSGAEHLFGFLNDTVTAPSTYSHALCRVLELVRAARLNLILLDVLLQAPVLTRYVWHHLYKSFCLSADKASCLIGMWLLRNLAVRRPVYRTCAVNILLQLCLSTHDYARRLAIKEVDQLLVTTTAHGTPLLDQTAEGHLLRYAKKQLFAIPAYQQSSAASNLKRPHDGSGDGAATAVLAAGGVGDDPGAAAGESDEATAKDRVRMSTVLNRRLGLFLMLCARQPRELFPALLEVFQQCVERGNTLMMQLLPENTDVRGMTQHLLKTDTANFVATVMPLLRKRCKEARPLVQSMMRAVREQLGSMAQEVTGAGSDSGGPGPANAGALETLRNISNAVLGHAKAMYELSGIPLGDSAQSVTLPDIRYLAPFLSFLRTTELRQTYLNAFLLFVQVQLQFQRHYQNAFHRLSAKERTYVLEAAELRGFQIQVLREVFVKCPVPFQDGVARGLTRVDFFVYLHRAPQESQARLAAALHANPLHAGSAGDSGGILDGLHDRDLGAGRVNEGAAGKDRAEELPPISVGTTKEVVNLCFELTRTFDNTTVERLYGPPEVQKALQQLMHPPPVPSQLMATVLHAATLFLRSRYVEFIKFVLQTILMPLERASVWDTDPQLWKGVIIFTERYYHECSNFLVNLPDQVLTQALREHPPLCEAFKEEHGNNASFGHILGNL